MSDVRLSLHVVKTTLRARLKIRILSMPGLQWPSAAVSDGRMSVSDSWLSVMRNRVAQYGEQPLT